MIFKTAIFPKDVHPTGVRDLAVSTNVFQQQWQGLVHSVREILPKTK
jgi:hypothetical protein